MAAADTQNSFGSSFYGTIFFDGLDKVFTASRVEPTLPANQMTECHLIDLDQTDQDHCRDLIQKSEDLQSHMFHQLCWCSRRR